MPYNRQIPDAPIAGSMLPRVAAADLKSQDILVLTQPGNPIGQKNKGLELGVLFNSDLFQSVGVRNSIVKSNILEYSGALAATSSSQYTEVCHLDVGVLSDVVFHVWGTSDAATEGSGGKRYQYGLRGKTEQYYEGEDIGNVLEAMSPSYFQEDNNTPTPVYNAVFGLKPYEFYFIQAKPTKRVTLYLSTGTSFSPYHATDPSSFSLKIQATIFPSKYESNVLKATTP
jgi:hypothetical protein